VTAAGWDTTCWRVQRSSALPAGPRTSFGTRTNSVGSLSRATSLPAASARVVVGRRLARLELEDGDDLLAPALARAPDDDRVGHRGVGEHGRPTSSTQISPPELFGARSRQVMCRRGRQVRLHALV
jgi:hypothetical protein